jgi:hypothetical protein
MSASFTADDFFASRLLIRPLSDCFSLFRVKKTVGSRSTSEKTLRGVPIYYRRLPRKVPSCGRTGSCLRISIHAFSHLMETSRESRGLG